jgi:hypothetical protein
MHEELPPLERKKVSIWKWIPTIMGCKGDEIITGQELIVERRNFRIALETVAVRGYLYMSTLAMME